MNPRPPVIAPQRSLPGWRSGFTLVELMIAIAIGLVMLVALLTLFINTSRSNSEMAKANSVIDNGRFAMQLLESDIAHAGFWGTHLPQFDDLNKTTAPDEPNAVPDPCLTHNTTNWNTVYKTNLIGIPLQAYEAAPTNCTSVVANRLDNTDVLVVRHAEPCVHGVGNCEQLLSPGKLYFQASLCELENATPYVLNTYASGTVAGDFPLHQRNCVGTGIPPVLPIISGDAAELRRFISNIYYIRNYAVTAGDGIPTLVRSEFDLAGGILAHQTAVPLIEGIEGFRVEFGIDTFNDMTGETVNYGATPANRGDGMPDGPFVHCTSACTAGQLTNVTAAKLYVLARAPEPTSGHKAAKAPRTYQLGSSTLCERRNDSDTECTLDPSYKRHLFSTTVRLTNVSVRREAP